MHYEEDFFGGGGGKKQKEIIYRITQNLFKYYINAIVYLFIVAGLKLTEEGNIRNDFALLPEPPWLR
jgi:hypothetical protein